MFNVCRESVLQDEKSSVGDSGDGITTMSMYLMPFNCIFKNG